MELVRRVVVFDAVDVERSSRFWAEVFGGTVVDDDPTFHCVIDATGNWIIGVRHAPDHVPPSWPAGSVGQQIHLDLHVTDPADSDRAVRRAGARLLLDAGDPDADEQGHRVFADPAGHPFCIGWGHPSAEQLARYLAARQAD